jgi:hypothetical protein
MHSPAFLTLGLAAQFLITITKLAPVNILVM